VSRVTIKRISEEIELCSPLVPRLEPAKGDRQVPGLTEGLTGGERGVKIASVCAEDEGKGAPLTVVDGTPGPCER
jgi:hypothetical protein